MTRALDESAMLDDHGCSAACQPSFAKMEWSSYNSKFMTSFFPRLWAFFFSLLLAILNLFLMHFKIVLKYPNIKKPLHKAFQNSV